MKMVPFSLSPSAYTDYLPAMKMHRNWPLFSNIREEGGIGYAHKIALLGGQYTYYNKVMYKVTRATFTLGLVIIGKMY